MTRNMKSFALALALTALFGACKKADQSAGARQVELTPAPPARPQLGDTAQNVAAAPSTPTDELSAAADAPSAAAAEPVPGAEPAAPMPAAEAPRPARQTSRAASPARTSAPSVARAPHGAPSPAGGDAFASGGNAPAAQPAPQPAAPTTGVIAGGSRLTAAVGTRICTNTHRVGDRVMGTLGNSLAGTNGALIPAGVDVTLRVTESHRGENGKEGVRLAVEPVSVSFGGSSYAISGSVELPNIETVRAQTTGDQAKKVAAGAAVGALAGRLLGKKNSSTVVGAAVGAAAGGAIAAGTADWNGCLAEGSRVTITLSGPVTVKLP